MGPRQKIFAILIFISLGFLFLNLSADVPATQSQSLEVTSANPSSAAQGTLNLNVTVGGKGFKKGAAAKFFATGTTDTGGIQVNSTTFVNPSQLTVNIDVADNATISKFDIQVHNSDGRTGKGTELFDVLPKGSGPSCQTSALPSGFTLVSALNPDPPAYTGEFGRGIAIARVTLDPATNSQALVAAVGSRISGKVEVFLLDPATGQVLPEQPHITLQAPAPAGTTAGTTNLVQGDVNGDSLSDIVVGPGGTEAVHVFLAQLTNGALSYSGPIAILPPTGEDSAGFGVALAVGDVDGVAGNELLVGAPDASVGGIRSAGKVFIFKYDEVSSFTLAGRLTDPAPKRTGKFGKRIAVGDVTGDNNSDVIVGDQGADIGSAHDAGAAFVFPGPLSSAAPIQLTRGVSGEGLGYRVATADVDGGGAGDVIAVAYLQPPAVVFSGPVFTGQGTSFVLTADPVLGSGQGFGTGISLGDINGDGLADLLVGAPNASDNSGVCASVGAVYLYFSSATQPPAPLSSRFVLQPSAPTGTLLFGWSVAAAPGSRLFLVGEPRRSLGGVGLAGQVYVFRRE
jgi:hypothetical protein